MQKEEAKQTTIYLTSINCTDPKLAERLQNAFHLAYARTLNGGRPIPDENAPLKFIKAWHKEKFKTTQYMMNYKEFAEAFAKGMQYRMQENMHGKIDRGTPPKPSFFYAMAKEDLNILAKELTEIIGVPFSGKSLQYNEVQISADHVPVSFKVVGRGEDTHLEVVWPKWIGQPPAEEYKEKEPTAVVPRKVGGA
ncbi:hypothetical protein H0O00_05520 [Candidatus Micrarchaeota archaeon]|nr:hypothetical protein [Candidatus Micrarchaeota archaeon]